MYSYCLTFLIGMSKIVKGHSSRSALFFLYSVRMVSTKYKVTNESFGVLGEQPMRSPKRIQRLQ